MVYVVEMIKFRFSHCLDPALELRHPTLSAVICAFARLYRQIDVMVSFYLI